MPKQKEEWFKHDSAHRDRPEVRTLRAECENERGFGVYMMLVELMREQVEHGYRLAHNKMRVMAFCLSVSEAFMDQVVRCCIDSGLFDSDGVTFGCAWLHEQMIRMEALSEIKRKNRLGSDDDHPLPDLPTDDASVGHGRESAVSFPSLLSGIDLDLRSKEMEKKNFAPHIRMTDAEYGSLVSDFGQESVNYHIVLCSYNKQKTGKKQRSDFAFVAEWIVRDRKAMSGFYDSKEQAALKIERLKQEIAERDRKRAEGKL